MSEAKVSTPNRADSILREIAEEYDAAPNAVSEIFRMIGEDTIHPSFSLFYTDCFSTYNQLAVQKYPMSCYECLGHDGMVMYLLFLAEYEENP